MNAPVLALIGEIPNADIGRPSRPPAQDPRPGRHHQTARPTTGIDLKARAGPPPRRRSDRARRRPAGARSLQCAIDVWGTEGPVTPPAPLPVRQPKLDESAVRKAAKLLGAAKAPMIVCGGGAQDASEEVAALSAMLQAPVLGYRRGRGVLDSRDPFSVTLPLGRELWAEADVVLGIGTRMLIQFRQWGMDQEIEVIRIDADADEPGRLHKPAAALIGDAKPVLRRLLDVLPAHNSARASRRAEMAKPSGRLAQRLDEAIGPQLAYLDAIRAELPEDGIFVDEVTQMGFAARLALPVYKPRTFLSPGYQDNLGWGFATALGAQDARRDVPVLSISGDGGFLFTANEMATAVRHRIPLTRSCSATARSAMSAASRRRSSATGRSPAISPIRIS